MLNRRDFVMAAAGAAFAPTPRLFAANERYELIIRGGRVIDPSARLDAIRDVAIAGGRIAAIAPVLPAASAQTLDASGKLVVPGLIDIHTHVAARGTSNGAALVLQDCVTGWIDAGSSGADGIDASVAIARGSVQTGRILINIGKAGSLPAEGDTMDLARADVRAARDAIDRHRDFVVGVKAKLSWNMAGKNDVETLRRAEQAAGHLPVMIHIGQTVSPLAMLMPLLKRGDIVTHMFAPPPNAIVDEAGRIRPEVLAARRRGVLFDVGNGWRDHLRWDIVEQCMRAGFWPDTVSTDWNARAKTTGVIDLPNCMSKFLGMGMSLSEVIATATLNAARAFPAFARRGTLKVGAPADVAILELREGTFEFLDNYAGRHTGSQRLFPGDVVLAGRPVARA